MICEINKNLITLKCVLFLFFGGKSTFQLLHQYLQQFVAALGSLFPFLPNHMNWVGLSRDEFTIISTVSPLIAVIGPLIAAPLADRLAGGFGGTPRSKTGRYLRVMISICLALATILYWLLLTVPRIVSENLARLKQKSFYNSSIEVLQMSRSCVTKMAVTFFKTDAVMTGRVTTGTVK
jgi:MFS family permease